MSDALVDIVQCDGPDGGLYIEINVNGHLYERIGGFRSREERQKAIEDITAKLRAHAMGVN